MLFTMPGPVSNAPSGGTQAPGNVVGTKATIGASAPEKFRSESFAGVSSLMAIRQTPMAMRAPTKTVRTGV